MLRGQSAVAFASNVSSGAASSRCLLGLRRRLSPPLSLRGLTATTSCLFFVMFSTGCQSHFALSTSSVYSSFNHYTKLLQSICEIAALQLIPPHPGSDCDHLSGLIYVCGG